MGATKIINVLKDDAFEELFDMFKNAGADEIIFVMPKKSKFLSKEQHFAILSKACKESGKRISLLSSNTQVNALAHAYDFNILAQPSVRRRKGKEAAEPIATQAARIPPQDDDIHDDSDDAYSEKYDRVVVPSDETIGIEHGEEDETEDYGLHIDEEDEKHNGGENPENEKYADENETRAERIGEDDIDADLAIASNKEKNATAVARIDRSLDAILKERADKTVKVSGKSKSQKMPMRRATDNEQLNDLEKVWRHEMQEDGAWIRKESAQKRSFWPGFFTRKSGTSVKKFSSKRRIGIVLGILAVLAGGGFVYVKIGSANIVLKPAARQINAQLRVEASDAVSAADPSFNVMPGQLLSVDRTVTQEFPATGQKEVAQKARGKITVYNAYGTTPQTLIATTRFESENGLIFRTLQTIVVPGTTVENGKIIPGSVDVDVIADKPGQAYNVVAGKFTIAAFREKGDADRFEKIYGQSKQAMQGGISGLAKVVTETDFNKAKDATVEKLKQAVKDALTQQATGLTIPYIPEAQPDNVTSSAQIDQAADTFTITAHGAIKTVAFKESDLQSLLRVFIDKSYALAYVPEKMNLSYQEAKFVDSRNALQLTVALSGSAYFKIDKDKITADLLGKSEAQIREYFKTAQGVSSARIVLSPFWLSRVPKNSQKVQIQIEY